MSEGDWIPESMQRDPTLEELQEYDETYGNLPPFGGAIAGFEFDPDPSADPFCQVSGSVSPDPFPLAIGYFPPNSFEIYEPISYLCTDGSLNHSARFFQISDHQPYGLAASFTVRFWGGPRIVYESLPEPLIEAIDVGGTTALLLKSGLPSGFGSAAVLVPLTGETGYIEVSGSDMPADELLKIAEGISQG
jgi:hypothetical protein